MVRETTELYGIVNSSTIRLNILKTLSKKGPRFQSEIAREMDRKQQDISKEIKRLVDEELIQSLNADKKSHKLYLITPLGKEVLKFKP